MGIPFGGSVRGKHTTGMKGMTNCPLYSVCITDSNGKPNVKDTGRYQQCCLYYIGSPINDAHYMGSGIITYDKVTKKRNGIVVTISGLEINKIVIFS